MERLRRPAWLALAFVLLGRGAHPVGQTPTTVSSGLTELIDFIAIDDQGRPVMDLRAADVSLKVDGRTRPIRSLEFVELSSPVMAERTGVLQPPPPEPFGSNRLADTGRLVMIVINHDSIRPGKERPARDAATRFLASLSSRDRVGLVTMPRGSVLADPTRDHEQVKSALSRVTGQAQQTLGRDLPAAGRLPAISAKQAAASDRACDSRLTLTTLAGMLDGFSDTDSPKTIVFISSGLMPPTRDAPMTRAPGACELRTVHYDEVGAAASAARAHFYVIQPNDEQADSTASSLDDRAASRFSTADDHLAGLQHLAGVTAGELYRLSAMPPATVFARVASESSAYYMLGFESEASERNGLPHRVEIKVARDRVTVRSALQLTIPKADVSALDLTPQKMLRTGRRFRDLSLRATAYTSRMSGDAPLKIVAAAEPIEPAVALQAAAFGLFDGKGRLTAQSSANAKELSVLPFVAALPASQGPYLLRVAAIDVKGRPGTVDYRFRADLTTVSGPANLKLSGLVLGVTRSRGFEPRLQFGPEPQAVAIFEIYGTPPRSSEITVRLELAPGEEETPILGAPATIRPGADADSQIVMGTLPIASLEPGDYVVRAIVNVNGKSVGRVLRTIRKVRT